jgi:ATP-binding cassette subfamily G (WHITE) protein 2 (PDR)
MKVGIFGGRSKMANSCHIQLGLKSSRNFGIIIAFTMFFMVTCLVATEYVTAKKSKGEILLFKRKHQKENSSRSDLEELLQFSKMTKETTVTTPGTVAGPLHRHISVFHWRNICFDIKIKKENHRILDRVDGWVRPGTLTALMVCTSFSIRYANSGESYGIFEVLG